MRCAVPYAHPFALSLDAVKGADCVWHIAAAVGPFHPTALYDKVPPAPSSTALFGGVSFLFALQVNHLGTLHAHAPTHKRARACGRLLVLATTATSKRNMPRATEARLRMPPAESAAFPCLARLWPPPNPHPVLLVPFQRDCGPQVLARSQLLASTRPGSPGRHSTPLHTVSARRPSPFPPTKPIGERKLSPSQKGDERARSTTMRGGRHAFRSDQASWDPFHHSHSSKTPAQDRTSRPFPKAFLQAFC
jgi:hypothetical protein